MTGELLPTQASVLHSKRFDAQCGPLEVTAACLVRTLVSRIRRQRLTPLMSKPKLSGNLRHRGDQLVGMTSQRLPGAFRLMLPSAMMTASKMKEDMIPRRDVKERIRRGRKVVGTRLRIG